MAIKDLLQHSAGKVVGVAFALLAIGVMGWMLLVPDDASAVTGDSQSMLFIDEDGNTVRMRLQPGVALEPKGPGGKPAFPAELCFWTKDGKPKSPPTPVLLKIHLGKREPTFCPDCDRLVVPMNPPATLGGETLPLPPTRAEYESRRQR